MAREIEGKSEEETMSIFFDHLTDPTKRADLSLIKQVMLNNVPKNSITVENYKSLVALEKKIRKITLLFFPREIFKETKEHHLNIILTSNSDRNQILNFKLREALAKLYEK